MFIKTEALFMSYNLVKLQKHVYVPRYMSACTGMCIEPHICTLGSQCVNYVFITSETNLSLNYTLCGKMLMSYKKFHVAGYLKFNIAPTTYFMLLSFHLIFLI